MKKIVSIIHIISSLEVGGAQTVLVSLIRQISSTPAHEFKHQVWYLHDGPVRTELTAMGVSVRQISGLFGCYDPTIILSLSWWLWRAQPNVVHSMLWLANLLARIVCSIFGIRCISGFHNHKKQDGMLRNVLDQITGPLLDQAVAVSQEVKASVADYCKIKPEKITVVTNGVTQRDELTRSQVTVTKEALFGKDTWVFGSVGRLEPVKEFDVLIKSFYQVHSQYKQVRLFIVGGGSQEAQLKSLIQTLGLGGSVLCVGSAPAERYLGAMDCFVLSSSQEGISLALLEAMGAGLCCITRHASENHEVITNGENGYVVPADNLEGLADVMKRTLLFKDNAKRIGFCAKNTIKEKFSAEAMAKKYEKFFTIC